MNKTLFFTVIFLISFAVGNLSGQQNTVKNENIPETESGAPNENSLPHDSVSGNVNSANSLPADTPDVKGIKPDKIKSGNSERTSGVDQKTENADVVKKNITREIENTESVTEEANKAENTENTEKTTEQTKKAAQTQVTVVKPVPERSIIGNGLLEIDEGNFKYKRIPGITLPSEKAAESFVDELSEYSSKNNSEVDNSFGIKKSTAVIFLLIMLILIIIVFKIRSKSSGGKKVLRRFP